jgi:GrpB-like predicted nucleotidyltransferase (UPF0157 family)
MFVKCRRWCSRLPSYDGDVAAEYGTLKRWLAKQFEHGREAYTEAKAKFIRAIVQRAVDHLDRD